MKLTKMPYGGDYNPEQWTPDIWEKDMELLAKAHVDVVTLNVFNWAMLQPNEDTYDFSALDATVKRVTDAGMNIVMATATGAMPAWMARKHPDILRTEWNGMRRKYGARHNCCPSSPTMHKYAPALVEQLAMRYKNQKNILAWHISNEYSGRCYCDNCEKAFRIWLQKKYGSLEKLNEQWCTNFWGHTFYDWDDIVVPNELSEEFGDNWYTARTAFQGISLDYSRFISDAMLENYLAEREMIKKYIPDAAITTNLMGACRDLDYQKWAKYMDFASEDNYPVFGAGAANTAMRLDLIRGLKGGQSWWLMEQTPSVSNWHDYCALKRPGVMRALSYQSIAHGADSVMFFQMRRSIGACEKYHGAIIDHCGNSETRVFREIEELGMELNKLGDTFIGARTPKQAAIIFDWDNWWAVDFSAGPSKYLKYLDIIDEYYEALHRLHINVDMISVEDDLTDYQVVFAPMLYMIKPGVADRIKKYVSEGGTFVTSCFSGFVNENDRVTIGGYPGELRELCGLWVEELDALPLDNPNHFEYEGKEYPAKILCDLSHSEGAQILAAYKEDFYAGMPALAVNQYGKGKSYYIATISSVEFYMDFMTKTLRLESNLGVEPKYEGEYIETCVRELNETKFSFYINHSDVPQAVTIPGDSMDVLEKKQYKSGEQKILEKHEVLILES